MLITKSNYQPIILESHHLLHKPPMNPLSPVLPENASYLHQFPAETTHRAEEAEKGVELLFLRKC